MRIEGLDVMITCQPTQVRQPQDGAHESREKGKMHHNRTLT
jgi:hypothetical protein